MSWYLDFSNSRDATSKGQETVPITLLPYLESTSRPHSDVLHRALAHGPSAAGYAGLSKALYTTEDAARKSSEETSV